MLSYELWLLVKIAEREYKNGRVINTVYFLHNILLKTSKLKCVSIIGAKKEKYSKWQLLSNMKK